MSDQAPTPSEVNAMADQVQAISEQIRPLLAGKAAHIQGAVLASLTATWVCGWVGANNSVKRDAFRWQVDQTEKIIQGILADRGEKL
jgi:spore coat polysaccharide biosynthesis protein SpsF (cytidylyltransferase family)